MIIEIRETERERKRKREAQTGKEFRNLLFDFCLPGESMRRKKERETERTGGQIIAQAVDAIGNRFKILHWCPGPS